MVTMTTSGVWTWVLWALLIVGPRSVSGTISSDIQCTMPGGTIGSAPDPAFHDTITTNIAFNYMVESHDYVFPCCGVVTQWRYLAANKGTIQFQVWRRESTNVYRMVGENMCAVTVTDSVQTCTIDNHEQIIVQKGDYIGWHNAGDEILYYFDAGHFTSDSYNNMFRRINAGELYPGDTYDWSQVEAYNDREYAIEATYAVSAGPVFTPTVQNVVVPDYLQQNQWVASFQYSDDDLLENSTLTITEEWKSNLFLNSLATGTVTYDSTERPRPVDLKYQVYDTCLNTATTEILITLQETALTLDTLDATFTVAKSITSQTHLYTFTMTDLVDQWYCSSDWSTASNWPFMLKPESKETFGFYVTESPAFDQTHYTTLGITCTENRVESTNTVSGNIQVYVTANQPPVFTNLDDAAVVDAETAFIGDTMFTVSATDPEGDILEYTMTCTPSETSHFTLTKNGNLQVMDWLILTTIHTYDCVVTVTDTSSNTDTGNLLISVINLNGATNIINMPTPTATLKVQENTPVGTLIYTFQYHDIDAADTKTWSITAHDTLDFTRYFNLDPSNGELRTAFSEINYEDLGGDFTHTLSITVGDSKSRVTEVLTLNILNENEPPLFQQDNYDIEVNEGNDGDLLTAGTFFTYIDDDLNDASNTESHTYHLDCDSATTTQWLTIDVNTGDVSYEGQYDLDTSGFPTDISCTITIIDRLGLSDTAGFHIHIKNVNEFKPVFVSTDYTIYLASNTLIGTQLLVVTAVDFDLDHEDELDSHITYELDQTSIGTELFAISESGVIYTKDALTSLSGNPYGVILALASNYGEAGMTGTASITIEIPATTTPIITTTDRNKDFYEDRWNYYWLLLTLCGIILILVAVSLVCFRICRLTRIKPWCYNCCMRGICCRPSPEKPRGFGDKGYDLASFGHRHRYADEEEEVDGWLRRQNKKNNKGKISDLPRSTTPVSLDTEGDLSIRQTPIYEMFRVPTSNNSSDPASSSRRKHGETWKDRSKKPPAIKPKRPSPWDF